MVLDGCAMVSGEVWVRGRPVRYQVVGPGEPVVLVHGLSGSSRWWRPNVPAPAARHRVYLVDLPGFGARRRQRREFDIAAASAGGQAPPPAPARTSAGGPGSTASRATSRPRSRTVTPVTWPVVSSRT